MATLTGGMTMLGKRLAAGAVALAALAWAGSARGDDVIRLHLPGDHNAPTLNLKATEADLASNVIDTRWANRGFVGFRGGFHGGYRGWGGWGGHRVGWGGWGGHRVGWGSWGWGRPAWGWGRPAWGWGRPGWGGWGWNQPVWGGGWGCAGGAFPVYSFPVNSFAYPCVVTTPAPTVVLRINPTTPLPLAPPLPMTPAPGGNGTYPYDGGPATPVPMPRADEAPTLRVPTRPQVLDERYVSLEGHGGARSGKWVYPAYGETPTRRSR